MLTLDPNKHYFRMRFIRTAGVISEAIKFVSRSTEATHVDLITRQGTYIGARANGGIQERPSDYVKTLWERHYALALDTKEEEEALYADARADIGVGYDKLGIAGLLFQNGWHDDRDRFCSEWAFDKACKHGFDEMLNARPDRDYLITPEILHLSKDLRGRCYYSKIGDVVEGMPWLVLP